MRVVDEAFDLLALMAELLGDDRPWDRGSTEALRRTARAAFEDWYEARLRAAATERKGQACSDAGLRL